MGKKGILAAILVAFLGLTLTACSSDSSCGCTKAPVYKRPCSCGN